MEKVVLKATRRDVTGKQVSAMRRAGRLPAVLYGRGVEPTPIALDEREATLLLSRLSGSSLITIELDGQEYPALVREKQRDFIKNRLLHVDFQAVSLTEKIRAAVRIFLTGTSTAVKDYNAVIVTGLDELEVEALPQDLPERITVDISTLARVGDSIHVRDLVIPDKVRVLSNPDDLIVLAAATKEEAVTEAAAPGAEAAEPEVIERGKKEEEEEGEAEGGAEKKKG